MSSSSTTLIPLSPMDAAMSAFGFTVLYVFPPASTAADTKTFDLEKLHSAFQRLVEEEYRILLGEQHIDPVTGVVSIKQTPAAVAKGASIAIPFEKVAEYGDTTEDVMQSLAMSFLPNREQTQVVTIKATALCDGGLALGVNMSHCMLDGEGMFTFMKSWGEFYRGLTKEERTVICHDRSLLAPRGTGALLPHLEFKMKEPTLEVPTESTSPVPPAFPATTQHVFHVTPERMKRIKAIASAGLTDGYVSTTDALTALFIILITQARGHGQDMRFTTGVNARKRFTPPLPANYAGNVIFNAFSAYTADELSVLNEDAIQRIAKRVRESILRRDDEYLRDAIEFISSQGNLMDVSVGTNFFFGPDLMFTSWANFGMYDAKFETTPWFVGPPKLPVCDGMVVFLEGIRGASGLDLLVLLETNAMERLVKLWEQVPFWN
uniref:Condensation domain-containing protein n=1 Tax=Globisporangium ultimum (strain ATCC 200006 / CBS 805.95 / DAOM BR144) TaxID=431595 RepID=K3W5S6_GLOUD